MSIVSNPPSPAASPRASFHVQRSSYSPYSPSASSSSPRQRASYAPGSAAGPRQTRPPIPDPSSSHSDKGRQYIHEGTQYSPDGLPPTAPQGKVKSKAHDSARKRKDPPESMNTTSSSASSASSTSYPTTSRFPGEPDLRRNPAPVSQSQSATAVPSSSRTNEPQEARSTHSYASAPKRSRPQSGPAIVMPTLYQNCDPKHLGVLISNMLMELIRINDGIPLREGRLTRFHSRAPPGISVSDYLQRLIHHATLSPPILLSMVWYIDLLCNEYTNFTINSLTAHRFLITAATVAAKGLSDSFWTNPTYAKIGGIPVTELATLELEFLQKVNWKIVPKPETLVEYYRSLVERTEGFELEGESSSGDSLGSSEEDEKDSKDDATSANGSGDDDGDQSMSNEPT